MALLSPPRKPLTLGLFGFGCVGYGLYDVLQKTPGFPAQIKKVCVRNPHKERPVDASFFTYDPHELLDDPDINVIVELIDDSDAAYHIVTRALRNGKAVVSANKKLLAEHFAELWSLQQETGVPLLYEAAACASLPIIRNLEEYYNNDLLVSVQGIVNGSTNYILTQLAAGGALYEDALREAQAKGYAESDPTLDTGGFDAKYKLLLLLAHAFGHVATPNEILTIGIDGLGPLELNYAREKNLKIKLVAEAFRQVDGRIAAYVTPRFVAPDERLYGVDDVFNGVVTRTRFADEQFFVGRGAGAHPTASAVISDISALAYDYRYEYRKIGTTESVGLSDDFDVTILLRYQQDDAMALRRYFRSVKETYGNVEQGYTIGTLSFRHLRLLVADALPKSVVLFGAVVGGEDSTVAVPGGEHVNPVFVL